MRLFCVLRFAVTTFLFSVTGHSVTTFRNEWKHCFQCRYLSLSLSQSLSVLGNLKISFPPFPSSFEIWDFICRYVVAKKETQTFLLSMNIMGGGQGSSWLLLKSFWGVLGMNFIIILISLYHWRWPFMFDHWVEI